MAKGVSKLDENLIGIALKRDFENEKKSEKSLKSKKLRLSALLLAIFLGELGIHRFYVKKIGTGILWFLTFGCFGIGWLVDLIMIISGEFKTKDGQLILKWINTSKDT